MGRNSSIVQDISKQRITHLFDLAMENIFTRPDLSDRYVAIAIRIARRTRVRIPMSYKRLFCKSCKSFMYPGLTSRVRINQRRSAHVAVTCLRCGNIKRYSIRKK